MLVWLARYEADGLEGLTNLSVPRGYRMPRYSLSFSLTNVLKVS
jgi:hypothetical protein